MLEAQQGDRISGKISRAQVASVAVAALGTGASIGRCLNASGQLGQVLGHALGQNMSVLSRELQAYDMPIAVSVMSKPQQASGVLQGRRLR